MSELLVTKGSTELVRSEEASITPMGILQMAISQNADIDKLTKLMELSERWDANQARKAYVQAMADFKKEAIVITRDKENAQYSKGEKKAMYTSIGNLVGTVTPLLSKHGLSAGWNLDQSSGIKVGCAITHALGHSETTWISVPLDTSGAKNPLQQIKSSITYARVVCFEMACGLASVEGNLDDDGNGATEKSTRKDQPLGPKFITKEKAEKMRTASTAKADKAPDRALYGKEVRKVLESFGFSAFGEITEEKHQDVLDALEGV